MQVTFYILVRAFSHSAGVRERKRELPFSTTFYFFLKCFILYSRSIHKYQIHISQTHVHTHHQLSLSLSLSLTAKHKGTHSFIETRSPAFRIIPLKNVCNEKCIGWGKCEILGWGKTDSFHSLRFSMMNIFLVPTKADVSLSSIL